MSLGDTCSGCGVRLRAVHRAGCPSYSAQTCIGCGARCNGRSCRSCYVGRHPGPVRQAILRTGVRVEDLCRDLELCRATVMRAARGLPMSRPVALALGRKLGIDPRLIERGDR